ncbi:hypothetical protein E2C01_014510 [Portunus trituberculatus]|uniref:Uncharacterized protein n=1 Tax=Portunus trituberculatus TaxID=210409 RepID=A0A5B7DJ18_PORTR|nr:hypothetical protein [Portunus trituberculatus]
MYGTHALDVVNVGHYSKVSMSLPKLRRGRRPGPLDAGAARAWPAAPPTRLHTTSRNTTTAPGSRTLRKRPGHPVPPSGTPYTIRHGGTVAAMIVAATEAFSRGRGRRGVVVAWHVTNPFDMAAARPPLR